MSFSFINLKEKNLLKEVLKFALAKKIRLFIVGGFLRDAFLGRKKENLDFDFCLKKNAIKFGHSLAKKLKVGFVVLDKEHGACRLVKKLSAGTYTLDFSDFRDKTLEKDLLHRDFTINAMALELEKLLDNNASSRLIIDPYGGIKDIKLKVIRAVNKNAFDEDPLRILRAFSLSALFSFRIDKETAKLIKIKSDKLSQVSFERIRDELFKILQQPDSYDYLIRMDKIAVLKKIFPEIEIMRGVKQGPYHHLDVWQHTLEALRQFEILILELNKNKDIQDYLNETPAAERKHKALIKLGILLHDIGKPGALRRQDGKIKFHGHERTGLGFVDDIAKRLRLSNDELGLLNKMVFCHLRPGYLADNEEITARAKFRYFRDTAAEAVSILLMSIADQRATRGPLTSKGLRVHHEKIAMDLLKDYFRKKKEKKPARLISGDDLMRKFKLQPSPLIGKILSEIEELQAIGKIKTKEDALKAAGKFV